jgi:phenylacetate-coenzyme A ligase PaaK-like adenylate-forming protein
VQALAAPCPCGNPQPAIRIEGRTGATVALRHGSGREVRLAPLALGTVVEEAAGEHRFQIAQVAPDHLMVRFEPGAAPARAKTWRLARGALCAYLAAQSLPDVRVTLDRGPPRLDPRSGKLHCVVVERPAR